MSTHITTFFTTLSEFEVLYVVASLIVAVLIWVEASLLDKNEGKFPTTGAFALISFITSSWLIVSGIALYFLEFDRFAISVPVVYGIYSVAGWVYGARLMGDTGVPDDPMEFVVPVKYLSFSKSFALVFAGLCVFVLASPYLNLPF